MNPNKNGSGRFFLGIMVKIFYLSMISRFFWEFLPLNYIIENPFAV